MFFLSKWVYNTKRFINYSTILCYNEISNTFVFFKLTLEIGALIMKHIRNVFSLYRLDWKRLFNNRLAFLLVIAMMIIPSLYAWFNIAALWDPYGNTSDLQIAVFSDDKTVEFQKKDINIGDKLIDNLHDNHQLGWRFVKSEKELRDGVKSGKYYAGIYIPEDFTENLLSFLKGDIKKPEIIYTVNEKINAIAPKITDKGATSLQETVSKEFIKTASDTVIKQLNSLDQTIDKNLPMIRKVTSLVTSVNDHIGDIDKYTQEVLDLQEKLPDLKGKLDKANTFVDYFPEINQAGAKLSKVNQMMPTVDQAGNLVLSLQGKIPEIQNAGDQIAQVDADFDGIVQTIQNGVNEAEQALAMITAVKKVIPEVQNVGTQAEEIVNTTKDKVIPQVQEALPSIQVAIHYGLLTIKNMATTIAEVATVLQSIDYEKDKDLLIKELTRLNQQLTTMDQLFSQVISSLSRLQEVTGSNSLAKIIQQLKDKQAIIQQANQKVAFLLEHINEMSPEEIQNRLSEIIGHCQQVVAAVEKLENAQIIQSVQELLDQLSNTLNTASKTLGSINQQMPKLPNLLDSTSQTIETALSYVRKYQKELPAIKQEVHDANVLLNGNMNLITNGLNLASNFYKNDFPGLKNKLNLADQFVKNDLMDIEKNVEQTLDMANSKFPAVETAVDTASDLIRNDYPTIKKGIQKAAQIIKTQEDSKELELFLDLLKADATKESDFFAAPVKIKQDSLYAIPNYGSASAPFYTALCLWVGGLLLTNVARTDFVLTRRSKKRFSEREQFVAKLLSFLTIGVFQALFVSLGNIFLLGAYTKDKFMFVFMTIIVALIFMSMLYVLAATFGNLGKGIGIILLVLSISGGGGNFPIQLSGKFFQMVNPILPFTYAVNLLREPVGGVYWPNLWKYLFILAIFGAIFLVLGIIFQPALSKWAEKQHHRVQKSYFFH